MTVFDASVLVDALVNAGPPGALARTELATQATLAVPAIFTAEATSALRALVSRNEMSTARANAARTQLHAVRVFSYPFEPFADRVWELRTNLTVYDGWYVALAERLGTDLATCDERLAAAPGPQCAVRLIREPGSSPR
jgi:predicted nucleic acid-binding protein